uniref:FAD/NAD(P)-binding protein n=1 Tax=Aquiflexum sp. TaxID=1872584 RepID=UPI0035943696
MKLWSSNNLTDIAKQNKKFLARHVCDSYVPDADFRVAIVGGGPKGAYAIERLASVWNSQNPGVDLDIVCFNESDDFASGPNYQTEQPDFLLMNYNLGKVDFWTDEQEQLVDDRPDLLEFLNRYKKASELEVESSDYCSRAVTGIYLQHCLCKVIEGLPSNIHLQLVVDKVKSFMVIFDKLMINTVKGMYFGFSEVMCCTGHSYSFGESHNSNISARTKDRNSPTLLQSVYPIHNLQNNEYSGKTVAVKGMGLTFIDAVLTITEGKGGIFQRDNGGITYLDSGREPKEILAFSKAGFPMIARQEDLGSSDFSLRYFTEETVDHLIVKHDVLDFKSQLLPFIQHEFRYQYVVHLLRFKSDKNILLEKTLLELEFYVSGIFPDFSPFDLEKFLSPKLPQIEQHAAVIRYLEETVFPERFDELHHSTIAMSALWREMNPIFNKLYSFGKLSGESQCCFDLDYYSRFQRVAFGPPKENMEKILALANAGVLKFDFASNPKVSIHHQSSEVKISNEQTSKSMDISMLIDARIPKSGELATQPEYIRKLILELGVDFFSNGDYKPGCLEIDKAGRLKKQNQICFYGTPTEGWTLDNESLSRSNNNFLSPWAKQIAQNHVN